MAYGDSHFLSLPGAQVHQNGIADQARTLENGPTLFALISTLPSEILCQIFIHAVAFPADSARSIWPGSLAYGWISVAHVCRLWRAVALSCPTLWNHIRVTINYDWMATLFSRSKEVPLVLSVSSDLFGHHIPSFVSRTSVENLVSLHSHRVRVLELRILREVDIDICRSAVKGPMPLLESLTVDCRGTKDVESALIGQSVEHLLYDANPPRLQVLNLYAVPLNWRKLSVPSLTCLSMRRNRGNIPTLDDFLVALAHMPLLQKLVVFYAEGSTATLAAHVMLPHLRVLDITAGVPFCTDLLRLLDTPALSHLSVNRHSEDRWLGNFFEAVGSKTRLMGHPAMLRIETSTSSVDRLPWVEPTRSGLQHSCTITAYREVMDVKTMKSPQQDLRARPSMYCVSFSWRESMGIDNPFISFCQHSSLDKVRVLAICGRQKEANMAVWWRTIFRSTVELERLILSADGKAQAFPLAPMLLPHDTDSRHGFPSPHYPLPHLRGLTLDLVDFNAGMPPDTAYAERVQDCLIERYEAGVEIETLRIQRAVNLETAELDRLRQVVRFVEWEEKQPKVARIWR